MMRFIERFRRTWATLFMATVGIFGFVFALGSHEVAAYIILLSIPAAALYAIATRNDEKAEKCGAHLCKGAAMREPSKGFCSDHAPQAEASHSSQKEGS